MQISYGLLNRPPAASTDVESLTQTRHRQYDLVFADIEGECNLRCVYCYQSDKDFKPHAGMSEAIVQLAVQFAKTYGRGAINITAQGEFTFGKNWIGVAKELLSFGVSACCTSNLSRPLEREEIETLSRFTFICLSLDTADRETLRKIRRSADVRAIAHNVLQIRGTAAAQGRNPPHMVVNCVLSTANARLLPDLAAYCYALGIAGVFVSPLHAYGHFAFDKAQLGDAQVFDVIEAWGLDQLKELQADLVKATAIAQRQARWFQAAPALMQRLNARLMQLETANNIVPPGMTRLCTQPWDRVVINHDGTIVPCCYGAEVVGNIATDGIEAVMHSEKLAVLKRALLTGENLPETCRSCVGEAITTPEAQRTAVANYLAQRR
jgi:radical SAM protein with 4Fe4S-binding SPASM domain